MLLSEHRASCPRELSRPLLVFLCARSVTSLAFIQSGSTNQLVQRLNTRTYFKCLQVASGIWRGFDFVCWFLCALIKHSCNWHWQYQTTFAPQFCHFSHGFSTCVLSAPFAESADRRRCDEPFLQPLSQADGATWCWDPAQRAENMWAYDRHTYNDVYIMIEGSLEVKLPTIWTDEKQSRGEAERRGRLEERRVEEKE